MSRSSFVMDSRLREWLEGVSARREPAVLAALRAETAAHPMARMQISVEQGRLLALLAQSVGARRALEVGTFTGYSAICIADALGPSGHLLCCDVSEEYTAVARRYWADAGLAERIELVLAPAAQTLAARVQAGEAGTYDLAFIDADKASYDVYYERSLELLRPGGLVALDNVFWSGKVADPAVADEDTLALRAITDKVFGDARVEPSLIPIGDGLLLARKQG